MAKVSEDDVLLLWRALMAFRSGPRPACRPAGKPPRSPCPLHVACPRWDGPDDYLAIMEETPEQTERRRSAWPCTRLADLLSPDLHRIGPARDRRTAPPGAPGVKLQKGDEARLNRRHG